MTKLKTKIKTKSKESKTHKNTRKCLICFCTNLDLVDLEEYVIFLDYFGDESLV